MTKPVTQADEPTLFPREWVIGRAAANLVRDDEGVLLDQPWIDPMAAAPPRAEVPRQPVPAFPVSGPEAHAADTASEVQAGEPQATHPVDGSDEVLVDHPASAAVPARRRRSQRPTAAEIDELKAGQARLQRRFEAARMRPRPRYLGDADRRIAHAPLALVDAPARTVRRRLFPWRRLAITLVLAALASGLYQYRAVLLQF